MGERVTSQQRSLLAVGSFALSLVGVGVQFGIAWALIVAGGFGVAIAFLLAIGAVR